MPARLHRSFQRRFAVRILLPILLAVSAAAAAAIGGTLYLAQRGDEVALQRQQREAQAAVTRNIVKLSTEQETIAVWDDPLHRIHRSKPDLAWLHENVGGWLHSMFGHDRAFILNAQDQPLYAMTNGQQVGIDSYSSLRPALLPFVHAARGRAHAVPNLFERLPGRPLPPGSLVLTGPRAIHVTDLSLVAGRPAIVSVMRMVSFAGAYRQLPGSEPLLISVRYLDGDWMGALEQENLVDGARYSPVQDLRADEAAFALRDETHGIGFLIWRPERPGTLLQKDLAWVGAGLAGCLLIILALLIRALYRSALNNFRSELSLHKTVLELRASEAQAQHLAFHDVLTGLPNRALFEDRLEQALASAPNGKPVGLLLLDIDRFKHVNDSLGHQAGDTLIREFAGRVGEVLPPKTTLARLGGDEFGVVVPEIASDELKRLCDAILEGVRRPFEILGANAFVGTSIGVIVAPEAGLDRVELTRKADIALYRAKSDGRNCWRAFEADMDETVKTRTMVEADLRQALAASDQLALHYQPQVASPGKPVVGLEALVRWHHPTAGLISPDAFIPIAEETGLIVPLGEWVLREACRAARRWPQVFIAVNLSPVQFRTANLADRVIAIVAEEGVSPASIELEITESVLVQDDSEVIAALSRLRSAGFRIALDDFGTGYSSLSYLRRFEVDKIKIDRSFIQNMGSVDAAAIVTAVVTLGHAMGLQVTAEGVETGDQGAFLAAAGCDVLQGYHYSRPLPADEIVQVLRDPRASVAA